MHTVTGSVCTQLERYESHYRAFYCCDDQQYIELVCTADLHLQYTDKIGQDWTRLNNAQDLRHHCNKTSMHILQIQPWQLCRLDGYMCNLERV